MIYGVDVYHGDGKIDWPALKKAGVDFAYVKLSQGAKITDSKGVANVAAAKSAGLLVGAYHYFSPTGDARAQYENFMRQVQLCGGLNGMLPPALDVEGDRNNEIKPMTAGGYVVSAQAWLADLERDHGLKAVVYTYRSFASEIFRGALAGYPLWASSIREPGKPAEFEGWGKKFLFHQYTTSGGGNIPIADQDCFPGTLAELQALVVGSPKTTPLKVVRWGTSEVIARYDVVENGYHPEQGKLYVK